MRNSTILVSLICCSILYLAAPSSSPAQQASQSSAAHRALDATLPEVNFTGVTLGDALDFIRDVSGGNMHVNWPALEAAGVGKDTQINIKVRHVATRKALALVLSEAGEGQSLTFYVDDGVIEVTTRELADKSMITRIYPVDDLLMEVPDFVGPDMNISSSGGGSGGGGGGGSSPFSGGGNSSSDDKGTSRADRGQHLIETITAIVEPEMWEANGGTATIRFFNGSLIVTAPRSVHEALAGEVD